MLGFAHVNASTSAALRWLSLNKDIATLCGSMAVNVLLPEEFRTNPGDIDVVIAESLENHQPIIDHFIMFVQAYVNAQCERLQRCGVVIAQGMVALHSGKPTFKIMCGRKKFADITFVTHEDAAEVRKRFDRTQATFVIDGEDVVVPTLSLDEVKYRLQVSSRDEDTIDGFKPEQSVWRTRKDQLCLKRLETLQFLELVTETPYRVVRDDDGEVVVGRPSVNGSVETIKRQLAAKLEAPLASETQGLAALTKQVSLLSQKLAACAKNVRSANMEWKHKYDVLRVQFNRVRREYLENDRYFREKMTALNNQTKQIAVGVTTTIMSLQQALNLSWRHKQAFEALVYAVRHASDRLQRDVMFSGYEARNSDRLRAEDFPFVRKILSEVQTHSAREHLAPFDVIAELSGSLPSSSSVDTMVHSMMACVVAASMASTVSHAQARLAKCILTPPTATATATATATVMRIELPECKTVAGLLTALLQKSLASAVRAEEVEEKEVLKPRYTATAMHADGDLKSVKTEGAPAPLCLPLTLDDAVMVRNMLRNVTTVMLSPCVYIGKTILTAMGHLESEMVRLKSSVDHKTMTNATYDEVTQKVMKVTLPLLETISKQGICDPGSLVVETPPWLLDPGGRGMFTGTAAGAGAGTVGTATTTSTTTTTKSKKKKKKGKS